MQLAFNEVEEAVAKTFQVILEREAAVERVRAAEQSDTGIDDRLWRLLAGAGALEVTLPGDGGGLQQAVIIAEMVGRQAAPVPFTHAVAALRLIDGARDADGSGLTAEVTSGDKVVTAIPARNRVAADTHLVCAGTVAEAAVTRDADGVWLLPRPGNVVKPDSLDGGSNAFWAAGEADRKPLASDETADKLWTALETDLRVLAAAELVGMADRAVHIGAEYARERTQFGMFIGTYQGVSHPLADSATAVEGARLLAQKAAWAVDEGESDRDALAAMAFVNAWEVAQQAAAHALRVHGGYGFMTEYDIQIYYRRAKALPLLIGSWQDELSRLSELLYGRDA